MDCCICLEELNEMVKLHDEHYCCKNCYSKIDKCPLCRVEVNPKQLIYIKVIIQLMILVLLDLLTKKSILKKEDS